MPKKPRAKATHRHRRCKRGHLLTDSNIYMNERGLPRCRTCRDKAVSEFATAGDKLRQQFRQYSNDR
jgi:hypothetical protein